ncbi:MAG: DUF5908 family protein [Gammaproteobacteria bacterium]
MPIEIKELHIKVSVNPAKEAEPAAGQTAQGGNNPAAAQVDKEALIAECVEQVLQILHTKMER